MDDGIREYGSGYRVEGLSKTFDTLDGAREAQDDMRLASAHHALEASTVNLFDADPSEPRPFTPGMDGFMRPATTAVWFGARGEGKSAAALTACVDVIEAGGEAVYLDLENGWLRTAERLNDILACRPDEVAERMRQGTEWWRYKDRSFDFGALADEWVMRAWLEEVEFADLVVIDAWSKVFGQLGLNEEHNPDVVRFMGTYIDPMTVSGKTSVLLLDNTGHAEGARPRGGSSKLDLCQLAYEVRGGQSCSRDKHGSIRLKRTRHRDGDELRELEVGFGGGRYTSIRVPEGGDLAKVKDAIGSEPRTKNEAYEATKAAGIKMRKQDFLRQIDAWAAEPGSGLDVVAGKVSVS
jgi:AAA domain